MELLFSMIIQRTLYHKYVRMKSYRRIKYYSAVKLLTFREEATNISVFH